MTDPDAQADGQHTNGVAQTPTHTPIHPTASRRRLLQFMALGAATALAGCGQSDSNTPTNTEGVSGQSFRAPTANDPEKTSFYRGGGPLELTAYAPVVKEPASFRLQRFLRESGVWVNGYLVPSPETNIHYNWIEEPLEISPTEVTVRIRDDARWSDGHPITGKDLAYLPLKLTLRKYTLPPQYAPAAKEEPQNARHAFDEFTIRDKSVTYRSSEGHFADFWDTSIAFGFGQLWFPTFFPTHIEPFDEYADAIIDMARRAQAGEIYPWFNKPAYAQDPGVKSLVKKHLADSKYVEKFSKPKNVLSTGPWELDELQGTEFIFKPNRYHRHSEDINFESFRFEFTESARRERAALKDGRLDYASPGVTPKAVVDSFPDHIKTVRIPGAGNGLLLNFDHPGLGTREVRQALMYALDHTAIANNIHQSAAIPVTIPGGDSWKATEYVSQKWINENLKTYPQNRERAENLMRTAGYKRREGRWVDGDGEPLTFTLPTTNSTPLWEPTVASQLSEFGIPTTVQTMEGSVFQKRRERGEFDIWPGGYLTGPANRILQGWYDGATKDAYMIYPDQQYKRGEFDDFGNPIPQTKDRYRVFTIRAPPVGQPNGQLQQYHPAVFGISSFTNPPLKEYRRQIKLSIWLANWFLPTIPINKQYAQRFIDAAHWEWPTETPAWQSYTTGDLRLMEEILRHWKLRAHPDNPEETVR